MQKNARAYLNLAGGVTVVIIAAMWIVAPIMARHRVDQIRTCFSSSNLFDPNFRCPYTLDDVRWWWRLHPPHWFSDNP